ncbi:MAG: hypothetical protein GY774_41305 [Planctomycetes bacterium]|nr:hypothetical protein [Planctomycetota bacterium]
MSTQSAVPYKLRPNKAVDRELFLSLLSRLSAALHVEKYKYIGLGGAYLEDFRLLHAKIGISDMDCVEIEEAVHKRQEFNRPIESIKCIHSSLEDYLDKTEFEGPVVLWLDYANPKKITSQIDTFSMQIIDLPIGSIIRITLNANPGSLGKPDSTTIAVKIPGMEAPSDGETELEWRLKRFKERLADYYPADLTSDDMKYEYYGVSVLKALRLAVDKAILDVSDRKVVWALATHYSDGQPMVTATLIITEPEDESIEKIIKDWEFYSIPQAPHILDLPALSTLERLTMESNDNPKDKLGYELPRSRLKEDPYEVFKRFYRVYPHFARIDL